MERVLPALSFIGFVVPCYPQGSAFVRLEAASDRAYIILFLKYPLPHAGTSTAVPIGGEGGWTKLLLEKRSRGSFMSAIWDIMSADDSYGGGRDRRHARESPAELRVPL